MPYIKKKDRIKFKESLLKAENAGELNYCISLILMEYFVSQGGRYQQINDCIGALEGAKLEFYRRVVAPYEDKKITENGDVYNA